MYVFVELRVQVGLTAQLNDGITDTYRNAPDQPIKAGHWRSLGGYSGHLSEFLNRFTEAHLVEHCVYLKDVKN